MIRDNEVHRREYVENGSLITGDMIKKIGFFIMDKNTEEFEMHVEYIKPYGQTQACFHDTVMSKNYKLET